MIDVRVLAVKPHPDQATNNPGCWAVQLCVSRAGRSGSRTFWLWHNVRTLKDGRYINPSNEEKPSAAEIIARFWDDMFAELHGFDFEREEAAT